MKRTPGLRAALAACALAMPAAHAAELAAPYVPTAPSVVARMLEIAGVGPDDYVIDLGSGDGRINVLAAAKHGARGHGIEIDPKLVAEANAKARAAGVADRVSFVQGDLFTADLSKASVVTLYLLHRSAAKLRDRLFALAPGTRIVSHAASMGEWKADRFEMLDVNDRVRPDAPKKTYIHYWVVPARVAGSWSWTAATGQETRECELELSQRFQMLEGAVSCDGRRIALARGRLEGAHLALELTAEAGAAGVPPRIEGVAGPDAITAAPAASLDPGSPADGWRLARRARR